MVSDGIVVEFAAGKCCYYPASFLLEHLLDGANQVLLNYDPCEEPRGSSLVGSRSTAVLEVVPSP